MRISRTAVFAIPVLVFSILLLNATVALPVDWAECEEWKERFRDPPPDCWPQTYWCWPGNAVTRKEISWELEQMHEHNIGGVLLNSAMPPVYEKGNLAYLADEYLAMVQHTAQTAARLNMKVNINFGEHWVFGGYWVPPQDRSQSLVPAAIDVRGPRLFNEALPRFRKAADHRGEIIPAAIPDEEKLIAVVAGKLPEDGLDAPSCIDGSTLLELTSRVAGRHLTWQVPEGRWRVMAFWLRYTGQATLDPLLKPLRGKFTVGWPIPPKIVIQNQDFTFIGCRPSATSTLLN